MLRPVRVAIDVRLPADRWGGVQQVVQGLASGLSKLDGPEEYLFIGNEDAADWLQPFLGGPARRLVVPSSSGRTGLRRIYDAIANSSPAAGRLVQSMGARLGRSAVPIPRSDGTIERLGVDLVHFILPQAYLTEVPSIYQIHDLLHIQHPELFSPFHRLYRQLTYSAFAGQARTIATMTQWGRRQIAHRLKIQDAEIAVVPWAPVTGQLGKSPSADVGLKALPTPFALYPSQTWPHKNHRGLIDAVAILRNRGTVVNVICTGTLTEEAPKLQRRIATLGLDQQVQFLGHVPAAELAALYEQASALIFPSRFEGFGMPILEAFSAGLPVAASNAAAIPEVAGGAALLFDPDLPSAIAMALERILTDEPMRAELRSKGLVRAQAFSWVDTARHFRALYRMVSRVLLSEEDVQLLATPVLVA